MTIRKHITETKLIEVCRLMPGDVVYKRGRVMSVVNRLSNRTAVMFEGDSSCLEYDSNQQVWQVTNEYTENIKY